MKSTNLQIKTIELLNPWWSGQNIELGIERTNYLSKITGIIENRSQILFVLGSRRVGKTRILLQCIYELIKKGVRTDKILFLSLDNSNLEGFDLYSYLEASEFNYVFLDEVHYHPNWAQVLKSLYDLPIKKFKIICSGSSSKLIEDNKAFLTGRSTDLIVTPLDFNEFKHFTKSDNEINNYLLYGGYPEYVLERQPSYLNELIRDVVEKDIIMVHKVKNSQYLLDIAQVLAKQIGFKGSSNKIGNILNLDNKTVEKYIRYLREVKLIEVICQYSQSINERLYAPKKYYFNDLGMRNSFVGFSDIGSLVENAVFLRLLKSFGSEDVFYLSDQKGNEVDFLVTLKNNEVVLIESKYNDLESSITKSINNLFCKEIYGKKVIKRIVVTNGVDSVIVTKDVAVDLISLENFLLKGI